MRFRGSNHQILELDTDGNAHGNVEHLFPLVYSQLRALAARYLGEVGLLKTQDPAALVHEAYLRLAASPVCRWRGQAHLLAAAAMTMRQILVSHVRRRKTIKRGGSWVRVTLDDRTSALCEADMDGMGLQDALESLAGLNERYFFVVMARYRNGMTARDIARALGVSERTVKSDWRSAREWLAQRLQTA